MALGASFGCPPVLGGKGLKRRPHLDFHAHQLARWEQVKSATAAPTRFGLTLHSRGLCNNQRNNWRWVAADEWWPTHPRVIASATSSG